MNSPKEQLFALLDDGDRDGALAFIAELSRGQRRGLGTSVLGRLERAHEEWRVVRDSEPQSESRTERQWRRVVTHRAAAIVLCTPKQLEAAWIRPEEDEIELLRTHSAAWLDEWTDLQLAERPGWMSGTGMPALYLAVRSGVVERPVHMHWALSFLVRFWQQECWIGGNLTEALRREPEFLEKELWQLFEQDGFADCNFARYDRNRKHFNYARSLCELSADGTIDRARLLDASLGALARDFAPRRADWFAALHEKLEPSLEERAERLGPYLPLLGSSNPRTVSFACAALRQLDIANLLPHAPLLEHIGPSLRVKSKQAVLNALRLLERAAKLLPNEGPRIASMLPAALMHEKLDIQKRALELLRQVVPESVRASEALRRDVEMSRELVKPSLRALLEEWLGGASPEALVEPELPLGQVPTPFVALHSAEELQREIAAALEGEDADGMAPERILEGLARLGSEVLDLEALVKRTGLLRKRLDHYYEMEPIQHELSLFLDALADECSFEEAREHYESRRRAKRRTERARSGSFGDFVEQSKAALAPQVRELIGLLSEVWEGVSKEPLDEWQPTHGRFFGRLLQEVSEDPRPGRERLSTPEAERGWISAKTLLARIRRGAGLGLADQVLSLLRLHPRGRTNRLREQASRVEGEYGRAFEHALGTPGVPIGRTAALWLAAARARHPGADDMAVEAAHPGYGPGGALAASCSARVESCKYGPKLRLQRDPEPGDEFPLLHPVLLFHVPRDRQKERGSATRGGVLLLRWSATLAPGCLEDYFAHQFEDIVPDADEDRVFRFGLEPLLLQDVPFGPNACRLTAAALLTKAPALANMACDVVLAGLGDGRLDAEHLGHAISELLEPGLLPMRHLARSLEELGRAGATARETARILAMRALRGDPTKAPRDLVRLLEVLRELCIECRARIEDSDARAYLEDIRRGSKTGRTCKELLAL